MAKKMLRIGLVFGGRSGEHEVSLASATSVMANLDSDKYEVVPIGITKQGSWLLGTEPARLLETEQSVSASTGTEETTAVTLTGDPSLRRLIPLRSSEQLEDNGALDVILPVLTVRTAKMARCKGYWRWPMCPTWVVASWVQL